MGNCWSKPPAQSGPTTPLIDSINGDIPRRRNALMTNCHRTMLTSEIFPPTDDGNPGYGSTTGITDQPTSISDIKKSVVIAIDIGTTYTGYAYSYRLRHDIQTAHSLKIYTSKWNHSDGMSSKAPTAVLLHPDGSFHSFGYEALDEYSKLATNGEESKYYFFKHFKMKLYNDQQLSSQMMLKDITGKPMLALDVFSKLFAYLKDHALTKLYESDSKLKEQMHDRSVQWVVTVPAIWNDKAKFFMRRAMEETGVSRKCLTLALEPEAASLYSRHSGILDIKSGLIEAFATGTKYMILDLGGGTIDETIHYVQEDGTLEELHHPTGGPWGGRMVNQEFLSMLETILGSTLYYKAQKNFADDFIYLETQFESKKRAYKANNSNEFNLRIPSNLMQFCEAEMCAPLESVLCVATAGRVYSSRAPIVTFEFFESPCSLQLDILTNFVMSYRL